MSGTPTHGCSTDTAAPCVAFGRDRGITFE